MFCIRNAFETSSRIVERIVSGKALAQWHSLWFCEPLGASRECQQASETGGERQGASRRFARDAVTRG